MIINKSLAVDEATAEAAAICMQEDVKLKEQAAEAAGAGRGAPAYFPKKHKLETLTFVLDGRPLEEKKEHAFATKPCEAPADQEVPLACPGAALTGPVAPNMEDLAVPAARLPAKPAAQQEPVDSLAVDKQEPVDVQAVDKQEPVDVQAADKQGPKDVQAVDKQEPLDVQADKQGSGSSSRQARAPGCSSRQARAPACSSARQARARGCSSSRQARAPGFANGAFAFSCAVVPGSGNMMIRSSKKLSCPRWDMRSTSWRLP